MAIFDLTLRGPLHQGEFVGINRETVQEWIPSDTLFAAIVTAWARQGADVAARLADFERGRPVFELSSAFPRAGEVRFYPTPARLPSHSGLFGAGQSPKKAREIQWLSPGVLEALQAGQTPAAGDDNFLHGRGIWLTEAERASVEPYLAETAEGDLRLWKSQVVPHAALDRASNASNLFHTGRVTFGESCGLWFAARGRVEWVREALHDLADSGLGGLRSTGHGGFTFSESATELGVATGGWALGLSRFAPASIEEITAGLQAERSAYRLVTVGGWCVDDGGHAWRRRSVRLVAEGALLPASVRGGLVDVRPLRPEAWHGALRPVYRNGLAFLIPAGKLVEAA
jgi:CRISPR-associated protein Csm4